MGVCISNRNSKLGRIPSVNLPPLLTCNPAAPCRSRHLCYAQKGRFVFKSVKEAAKRNLELSTSDYYRYFDEIRQASALHKYFRWHASGDIPTKEYLLGMIMVANLNSGTNYLAFTKQYDLVNGYIACYGELPCNLKIVFSDWCGFVQGNNPNQFPVAHVLLKGSTKEECSIPENSFECGGMCEDCVLTNEKSCWKLCAGESVFFDFH